MKKEQILQLETQRLKEELEKRNLETEILKRRFMNGKSELEEIHAKIQSIEEENMRRAEEKKRIEALRSLNGYERRTFWNNEYKPPNRKSSAQIGWNMQETMMRGRRS